MTPRLKHPNPDMGERGRKRRERLGMSVGELSRRLGFSWSRVWGLENEGAGTIRIVEQWAQALDMHPGELAFGIETERARRAREARDHERFNPGC